LPQLAGDRPFVTDGGMATDHRDRHVAAVCERLF
jgi:hypothetical protein